jgi:hypothetical protein
MVYAAGLRVIDDRYSFGAAVAFFYVSAYAALWSLAFGFVGLVFGKAPRLVPASGMLLSVVTLSAFVYVAMNVAKGFGGT